MADQNQIDVIFGAKLDGLNAGVDQAKSAIRSITDPIEDLKNSFGTIAESIAGAFAVEKVMQFVESMERLAIQTERTMALLGVSAKTTTEFNIAAQSTGGNVDGMTRAIERMGSNLTRVKDGTEPAAMALRALGINMRDFLAMPTEDKLKALADGFSRQKDGIDKDAIAIALLGRAGAEMIPTFNQGSHAFEEFAAMADRASSTPTQEFLNRMHEIHEATIETGQAFQGLGIVIMEHLGGPIAGLIRWFNDLVEAMTRSIREGGALGQVLDLLGFAFKGIATSVVIVTAAIQSLWELMKFVTVAIVGAWLGVGATITSAVGGALGKVGALFVDLWDVAKTVALAIGQAFADVGKIIVSVFLRDLAGAQAGLEALKNDTLANVGRIGTAFGQLGTDLKGAITPGIDAAQKQWQAYMASIEQQAKAGSSNMATITKNLTDQLKKIWSDNADEVVKIEQNKNSRLDVAAKERAAAQLAHLQAEMQLINTRYSMEVEKINSTAKQSLMSSNLFYSAEQQKTSALLAAVATREAAELDTLNKMSAIWGLSKEQYQKIEDEKTKIKLKAEQDRQKINDQAAEAETARWKSATNDIAGAWNSHLRELYTGQLTFSQAVGRMMGDLIIKWTGDLSKFAIEWFATQIKNLAISRTTQAADTAGHVAAETTKTAATTTSVATRTSAEVSGSSAGLLGGFADAIKFVFTQAAKAFAGVFAFLSPAMGPAAAGPAAGAEATVMGATALIPAAAAGTDFVVRSGMAMIHKGEQVVPAALSGPYTGANNGAGGQGGQGDTNITLSLTIPITAWDGHSVNNWMTAGGGGNMIAQRVAAILARNPSLRPKY